MMLHDAPAFVGAGFQRRRPDLPRRTRPTSWTWTCGLGMARAGGLGLGLAQIGGSKPAPTNYERHRTLPTSANGDAERCRTPSGQPVMARMCEWPVHFS